MPEMARPSATADNGSECETPPKASHSANPEAAIATAALATTSHGELVISAQALSVCMPM